MNENTRMIISLSDGMLSSVEIANIVGLSPRYVRKVILRHNLPRLKEGAQAGKKNHQYKFGRYIDLDGYVLVSAPNDHYFARIRKDRGTKLILEHRLVLEKEIGRYLQPEEVVDHIDGLTLHNNPSNLRLFSSNAEHLRATVSNKRPNWTEKGLQNIGVRTDLGLMIVPVDSYRQHKVSGDVRLRQILLCALSLGKDNPYLLGSYHHTLKAGIDMTSRSTIELALDDLYSRWGASRAQSQQGCHQLNSQPAP